MRGNFMGKCKCPKCGKKISSEDKICSHCGCDIERATKAKLQIEMERRQNKFNENEERKENDIDKYPKDKVNKEVKKDKKDIAQKAIIDCEGNKFKAIKLFMNEFDCDTDEACNYINQAYSQISKSSSISTSSNDKKNECKIRKGIKPFFERIISLIRVLAGIFFICIGTFGATADDIPFCISTILLGISIMPIYKKIFTGKEKGVQVFVQIFVPVFCFILCIYFV